jgi:hypothetical protein
MMCFAKDRINHDKRSQLLYDIVWHKQCHKEYHEGILHRTPKLRNGKKYNKQIKKYNAPLVGTPSYHLSVIGYKTLFTYYYNFMISL